MPTLEPLSDFKLMTACAALDTSRRASRPRRRDASHPGVDRPTLARPPRRDQAPHQAPQRPHRRSRPRTGRHLRDRPDIAGELLVAAGDNTDRVRSDAAFAKLCGVCPIPTGSGKTSGRHRLNRGGNRQANAALYRCVIVRMRWHAPDHRLRHQTHRRRPDQEGHHPLPQALRRTRGLRTAPSPRSRTLDKRPEMT